MAKLIRRYVSGSKPQTVIMQSPPSVFSPQSKSGERFLVDDWLYDSVLPQGVNSATLFQTPKGQSSKTYTHTNQTQAGMLPFNKQFLVKGYSIYIGYPWVTSDTNDAIAGYIDDLFWGYWEIKKKGNVVVQTGPIHLIAQFKLKDNFARVSGDGSTYKHFYYLDNPHFSSKGYFPLSKEGSYLLEKGDEFNVELHWENTISNSNPFYIFFVVWGKSDRSF